MSSQKPSSGNALSSLKPILVVMLVVRYASWLRTRSQMPGRPSLHYSRIQRSRPNGYGYRKTKSRCISSLSNLRDRDCRGVLQAINRMMRRGDARTKRNSRVRGIQSWRRLSGPSNLRKVSRPSEKKHGRRTNGKQESTLSKFPHGYTHAPPPGNHHGSMFKATITAQHQLQHTQKPGMPSQLSQLVPVSNARIPFAENANPPATAQHHGQGQTHPATKTCNQAHLRANSRHQLAQHKLPNPPNPSPLYANGDNIQLPDIATDSEDEESDEDDNTGFRAPSWVASPALRDLLTQQQLVDPETVFGPIGELKMEEVFRNGKNQERLKKFRDRSSSAAWVQNGDAVTSAGEEEGYGVEGESCAAGWLEV